MSVIIIKYHDELFEILNFPLDMMLKRKFTGSDKSLKTRALQVNKQHVYINQRMPTA